MTYSPTTAIPPYMRSFTGSSEMMEPCAVKKTTLPVVFSVGTTEL